MSTLIKTIPQRRALLARVLPIAASLLLGFSASSEAQISVGIGLPRVNIGINVGGYPDLVLIPGYPVYYDPRADSNYFYYDDNYWVYRNDTWYSSGWYNGPWQSVNPEEVSLFVLRVPVQYYRQPPSYFRGWNRDEAPRWGERWGREWQQHREGWDHWNHNSRPQAAPLPTYQRQYSGNRYPSTVARRAAPEQRRNGREQHQAPGGRRDQHNDKGRNGGSDRP